jgi:uracil-DNA glycosylase
VTQPPILIVGEAWGEAEAKLGAPFVGPSGAVLLRMCHDAGLLALNSIDKHCINRYYETQEPDWIDKVWRAHATEVKRTNVFNVRPDGNDIDNLCGAKGLGILGYPPISGSKYILAIYEPELNRLANEVLALNPNLIICLGNTPLWALGGRTGIKKWRGTTLESTHTVAGYKLLATYHPAAVLRGWELRPIVIADLMKAAFQSTFPDIRRPHREIWIEPGLDDIRRFCSDVIQHNPARPLSVDIETSGTRITCIGLGYSDIAIVIPFDDERAADGNYWPSGDVERAVWALVASVLSDASIPKLFQNGLYDIAFLWRSVRVKVLGAEEDTMLLHHALQPELEKSLGFLGSIYADDLAWKHGRKKVKTIKRDA